MGKHRRHVKRVFMIAAVLLLVANVASGIVLMGQAKRALKHLIQQRMLDISNTASDMIDGDEYVTITGRDESNPAYKKIYDTLACFQSNIDFEYIYTIRKMPDGTYIFTIDPAPENASEYGQTVKYTDALNKASFGVAAVDDEPYTDEWGRFYSSYSPIFNSKHEVVGIIAVDFSADWIDSQLTKNARTILSGILISIIVGVVAMAIVKYGSEDEKANAMITAMACDYRSVYYVNLDDDSGVCYRAHTKLKYGLTQGEHFL